MIHRPPPAPPRTNRALTSGDLWRPLVPTATRLAKCRATATSIGRRSDTASSGNFTPGLRWPRPSSSSHTCASSSGDFAGTGPACRPRPTFSIFVRAGLGSKLKGRDMERKESMDRLGRMPGSTGGRCLGCQGAWPVRAHSGIGAREAGSGGGTVGGLAGPLTPDPPLQGSTSLRKLRGGC